MNPTARWLSVVLLCMGATGCECGDDDGADGGTVDAPSSTDGGREEIDLEGLDGPVEVMIDTRGMPHIYATTVHDAVMVEGYVMARDRFIQMEFIRRGVTGRLAEALGALSPGLVEDDAQSRFFGFRRQGRAIYESLPADNPSRLAAEAFVAGINAYIDQVIRDPSYVTPEGLELFNFVRLSPRFGPWEPADVFALARYQSFNLAFSANEDIARTQALRGARTAFSDTSTDPRIQARSGVFADLWGELPARFVFTRWGFPDGTTQAFLPPHRLPRIREIAETNPASLAGGARFFERLQRRALFSLDPHIGSNSWVVSGTHTASGAPILANDPHLSLISPPVWYYVHLNTTEAGGNVDAMGVAFAGLPGVVLGTNRTLAWSATTTGYDVTDVYAEQVTFQNTGTAEAPQWVPASVLFNSQQVDVVPEVEEVHVAGEAAPRQVTFYRVPHHGLLIPDSIVAPTSTADPRGTALSIKYTGEQPSNELAFFIGLLTATNADEAFAALDNFEVGAQNFSFVDAAGNIAWSTRSRIPQREALACSYNVLANGAISGTSPLFVLPGTGGFEWTEPLDERFIPHDRNPANGYIATANQDAVGVTADGNPCNGAYGGPPHYIGGGFEVGYRQHRIAERLIALTTRGDITAEEMIGLQAESRSQLGDRTRLQLVLALTFVLEGDTSGDPALTAALTEAGDAGRADLRLVRDRLQAWSLQTPHGVGASDPTEIADSIATTIFNMLITRLAPLAFEDETDRVMARPDTQYVARALEWSLYDDAMQDAAMSSYTTTYVTNTGVIPNWNDTVLWDDLDTDVVETRHERVVRAALAAVAELRTRLGPDVEQWRWGRLHAVRFGQIVQAVSDSGIASIPEVGSTEFPIGFPRHGDYGAVDVGNFGLWNTQDFTHRAGASQRFVVEMTPTGPRAFNALPGGQSEVPRSRHHADEAELWRLNQQPPLHFERAEIEAHLETRLRFE